MKTQNSGKLRIGDLAKQLQVKEFVIRFWEREFKIKARRSAGGQRFYTKQHVALLEQIKDLLYTREYTIAGAKKHLEEQKTLSPKQQEANKKEVSSKKIEVTAAKLDVAAEDAVQKNNDAEETVISIVIQRLSHMREKLIALKELL